jgi:hypothetical protein
MVSASPRTIRRSVTDGMPVAAPMREQLCPIATSARRRHIVPPGEGCALRMSASLMARSLLATLACTVGLRALAMQWTVMAPVPAARPIDS